MASVCEGCGKFHNGLKSITTGYKDDMAFSLSLCERCRSPSRVDTLRADHRMKNGLLHGEKGRKMLQRAIVARTKLIEAELTSSETA